MSFSQPAPFFTEKYENRSLLILRYASLVALILFLLGMGGAKPLKDGGAILLFCLFWAHGRHAVDYMKSSRLAQIALLLFAYFLIRTIISASGEGVEVAREWDRFWRHSRILLLAVLPFFLQQVRLYHVYLLVAFSVTALTFYDLQQIGGLTQLLDPGNRIYLSINQQWMGLTLATLMLASVWFVSSLMVTRALSTVQKLSAGSLVLIVNVYWFLAMLAIQPRAAVGALALGAMVAFAVAIFLGFTSKREGKSVLMFSGVLFFAAVIAAGYLFFGNQSSSVERFADDNVLHMLQPLQSLDIDSLKTIPDSSSGYRLKMWGVSLLAIPEAPLFGHGINSVEALFAKHRELGIYHFNHAHNTYLDITLRFGLVGLFAYLCLWILALWQAVKNYASGYLSILGLSSLLGMYIMFLFALFFESYNLPSHGWYMVVLMMSLMTVPWKKKS